MVEQAVLLAEGTELTLDDFPVLTRTAVKPDRSGEPLPYYADARPTPVPAMYDASGPPTVNLRPVSPPHGNGARLPRRGDPSRAYSSSRAKSVRLAHDAGRPPRRKRRDHPGRDSGEARQSRTRAAGPSAREERGKRERGRTNARTVSLPAASPPQEARPSVVLLHPAHAGDSVACSRMCDPVRYRSHTSVLDRTSSHD